MPPQPALERLLPEDQVRGGWYEKAERGDGREVLFRDGAWRWVGIVARCRDRRGRLCVLASCRVDTVAWEEWYVADDSKMRDI